MSCLFVRVVSLDEAGVREGLPGQLALLPRLSSQLTLNIKNINILTLTLILQIDLIKLLIKKTCYLVNTSHSVCLDSHAVTNEDNHILGSPLVFYTLQHSC